MVVRPHQCSHLKRPNKIQIKTVMSCLNGWCPSGVGLQLLQAQKVYDYWNNRVLLLGKGKWVHAVISLMIAPICLFCLILVCMMHLNSYLDVTQPASMSGMFGCKEVDGSKKMGKYNCSLSHLSKYRKRKTRKTIFIFSFPFYTITSSLSGCYS